MALIFAWQRGKHSRLAPQELCPTFPGNQIRSYRWGSQSRVYDKDQNCKGLAFFLHYFKTVTAGVRQPDNWVQQPGSSACLSLVYLSF